jgi:hypothetical protein
MPLQSRVSRPSLFPPGYRFRLALMTSALVLIGLTIYNLRGRARAANAGRAAGVQVAGAVAEEKKSGAEEPAWTETVADGLADDDPLEMEQAQKEFEAIEDGEILREEDMFAYWRLMRWARNRSFAELESRAKRDVPFVKLCDIKSNFAEARHHRGELIRLRLHIRRIVEWDQRKENSAGVKTVYELWATTDESKSHPYAVAVAELPPEIPVKADASSEAVFVGYFLKALKYPSEDRNIRGAPLLIGRVKAVKSGRTAAAREQGLVAMIAIGAAILLAALIIVFIWQMTRKKRSPIPALAVSSLPTTAVEDWLESSPGEELAAVPPEAGGSGTIVTNGQAKHAVGSDAPDSTDHVE